MFCSTTTRINGVDVTETNCFMYTTPEEGKTYCMACEGTVDSSLISPQYGTMQLAIKNPKTQKERVNVTLCTCKSCAMQFAMYGTD